MENASDQKLTIGQLANRVRREIGALDPASTHALISCSKTKGDYPDRARDMYTSALYRKSVLVVEGWGLSFSILSAKYGLLDPDDVIEPYDLTLKGASREFKSAWAHRVHTQIRESKHREKRLVLLAGDDYYAPLAELETDAPLNLLTPLHGLSLGSRLQFLNESIRIQKRRTSVSQAYVVFAELAKKTGLLSLRELLGEKLPQQGVYFFFDDNEPTRFSRTLPRLVRVGTHGISAGSVATLRNRLRTHLGTRTASGNHRASVFRLHVGRAIIKRDKLEGQYPEWGKGQSAPKEVTIREAPLEALVSNYIGSLRVLYVPVLDAAGTSSMRATIERQFISLFTENNCPVEEYSPTWLGQYSDKLSIRASGLWNVRDVGGEYDYRFLPLLDEFLSRTVAR